MTIGQAADGQRRYKSYVLRLWETDSDGQPVWRASLHDSDTGERRGFASLGALAEFLAAQTKPPAMES